MQYAILFYENQLNKRHLNICRNCIKNVSKNTILKDNIFVNINLGMF